jgi:acyl-CoA synthetase (NDP forming)
MSQQCISCDLSVPELVPGDVWRDNISGRNPFYIPSHLLHDKRILPLALKGLSERDDLDMIILVLSFMNPDWDDRDLAEMVEILKGTPKPSVCCCLAGGHITASIRSLLDASGIPLFSSFRRCARALGSLQMEGKGIAKIPQLPQSLDITHELPEKLTEYHAKHLLSKYGVEITREQLCRDLQEALEAADAIGYPVALKVMSPNIIQKSQARIIALDLKDQEEVRNAYGRTIQRAIAEDPEAEIIGVLIQEMLETGIECMINVSRDPVFGPVISVGLGGIYVEFLHDRSTRIAPVDIDTAREMITELKGFPILKGLWGQAGYDISSLARVVSQVSRILFVEEGLDRISINPVFVRENDAVVVDAFIIRG